MKLNHAHFHPGGRILNRKGLSFCKVRCKVQGECPVVSQSVGYSTMYTLVESSDKVAQGRSWNFLSSCPVDFTMTLGLVERFAPAEIERRLLVDTYSALVEALVMFFRVCLARVRSGNAVARSLLRDVRAPARIQSSSPTIMAG